MSNREEVKEDLIQNDHEFRRLYQEHQDRERRLDELVQDLSTPSESEFELKAIKIEKLRLKDRMEEMIRDRLEGRASA